MGGYHCTGKQVLNGRDHVADAIDNETAQLIADALNLWCVDDPCPVIDDGLTITDAILSGGPHAVRSEGDEYACVCGMRWDRSEGPDHP